MSDPYRDAADELPTLRPRGTAWRQYQRALLSWYVIALGIGTCGIGIPRCCVEWLHADFPTGLIVTSLGFCTAIGGIVGMADAIGERP